jgi:hypothetical protein
MRLTVDDPNALPALVAALRASECVAEPVDEHAVDVLFPWVEHATDARQAFVELDFFARAWEALHPGTRVRISAAGAEI